MSTLSVVNDAITIPGVAFKKNAVIFEKELPLDKLNALAANVAEMHGGTAWWLGDVGLAIQENNRRQNEVEAVKLEAQCAHLERELEHIEGAGDRDDIKEKLKRLDGKIRELRADKGDAYRAGRAEILGIDPGYWANCVMICRYYPPSHRCEGLGIPHHHLAMQAAGGAGSKVKDAQGWLKRAQENAWSASDMRKQINIERAAVSVNHTPFANEWAPLDEADKWATSHRERAITPDAARALLTRWQSLIEFVERLRSVAGL